MSASHRMLFTAGVVALTTFQMVPAATAGNSVTLTMDEVTTRSINGLSITKGFETFNFSYDETSSVYGGIYYNDIGPEKMKYLDDHSIVGENIKFSVSFSVPVSSISFGFSELTKSSLLNVVVTLSDRSSQYFELLRKDNFPEGQFSWSGAAVTGFTLFPAAEASGIAFDNLKVTQAVPAPGPIAGAGLPALLGLMGFAVWRRRQQQAV